MEEFRKEVLRDFVFFRIEWVPSGVTGGWWREFKIFEVWGQPVGLSIKLTILVLIIFDTPSIIILNNNIINSTIRWLLIIFDDSINIPINGNRARIISLLCNLSITPLLRVETALDRYIHTGSW